MEITANDGGTGLGIVDGHVHLDRIPEVEQHLEEARKAGVAAVVGVGMEEVGNRRIMELAEKHPGFVHVAVGLHPWMVKPESWEYETERLIQRLPSALALGEVGLDYKYHATKALQKQVFSRLLESARRFGKPVIVHSRYSHARCLEMLRESAIRKAVFHWYSGPSDVLAALLDEGYFISATPALAYSEAHREAVRRAPREALLLETDAPVDFGQGPSRPVNVLDTLRLVAEIYGCSVEEAARVSKSNTERFFGVKFG